MGSNDELNIVRNCSELAGSLIIAHYGEPVLHLGNIEKIKGSLKIANSPQVARVEAPALHTIANDLVLQQLTSLASVSLPLLRLVKRLDWTILPILSIVRFSHEIGSIESITVSDTSLVKFSGFMADDLDRFDINNNRFLESITSNVQSIKTLHIAANAQDVVVKLPKLESVHNVSIHEVGSLDMAKLREINSSASIINNRLTNLALPELTHVGDTLSIQNNNHLEAVDLPEITDIDGGLMIVNNTKIERIDFLPRLTTIGGALELEGNIRDINLTSLRLIKGSARVQSLSPAFDCGAWSQSDIGSVIRGGNIECLAPSRLRSGPRNALVLDSGAASGASWRAAMLLGAVALL